MPLIRRRKAPFGVYSMRLLNLAIFLTLMSHVALNSSPTRGSALGDMQFIISPTFAFDTQIYLERGDLVRTTLLPYTTIVSPDPDPSIDAPIVVESQGSQNAIGGAGNNYLPIITQHGQRALVFEGFVWPRTFRETYPSQDIAVHQRFHLCADQFGSCPEGDGIPVVETDVLSIQEETPFYVKFIKPHPVGGQSNFIAGFLSKARFNRLLNQGVITDTRRFFPRIIHKGTKYYASLSTNCGETRESIDVSTIEGEASIGFKTLGLWDFLINFLSVEVGARLGYENQEELTASYGGDNIATELFEVILLYPNGSGDFYAEGTLNPIDRQSFFVAAEVNCSSVGQTKRKIHVNNIAVSSGENYFRLLEFENFYETPKNEIGSDDWEYQILTKNGGAYFMTSILDFQDYQRVIQIYYDKLGDIDLAHILLSLFNRSCWRTLNECVQILGAK